MNKIRESIHPDDDMHYQKMGLDPKTVELWEDGARVEGKRGEYEWWYYDSHYPDGTILVIFMFSKNPISVDGPVKPMSTMELTLPDGTKFSEEVYASIEESHYAKDRCDVKIGECFCKGDLKHYDVVFKGKTMSATAPSVHGVRKPAASSLAIMKSIILLGFLPFPKVKPLRMLLMTGANSFILKVLATTIITGVISQCSN